MEEKTSIKSNLYDREDQLLEEQERRALGAALMALACTIAIAFSCVVGMGLVTLILGLTHPGECDITDKMGLNIADYLVIQGILMLQPLIVCPLILSLICCSKTLALGIYAVYRFIYRVSVFVMFIIGAIILFRSNTPCIDAGSSHVVYALVIWILSAIHELSCSYHSRKREESK